MLKKSFLLLTAVVVINTSCETLCEKGIYQFCEENTPPTLGQYVERSLGPNGEEPASFSIGQKGYVGAGGVGFPAVFNPLKEFYSYDPATDKWDTIASLPGEGRLNPLNFGTKSKGYVGGGYYYLPSSTGEGEVKLKDFYEYDPQTNSWTKKADLPGGEGVYVGFGIRNKGYALKEGKFWEYNPAADQWTPKADCPAQTGLTFSIGLFGYVVENTKVWEYNSINNTWKAKANAPEVGSETFATTTKGYLVSSYSTYEFSPISNTWVKKADTPKIQEAENEGYGLRVQHAFGVKDKGYLGIDYRSRATHFFEFDPNK